jgi:uncharacterized OsmC-like protein
LAEIEKPRVLLKLQNGYQFYVSFPGTQSGGFVMDEPAPLGTLKGPNASRVLAASVANCLSASLLFCLKKSRIEVEDIEAEAEPTTLRNEEGCWRVRQIDVSIRAKLREPVETDKVRRCLELFEKYCVVTGAVREGLPVNVKVDTGRS